MNAARIAALLLFVSACARREEPAPAPKPSASVAASASAAPVDPCARAKQGMADFIATLDRSCKKDQDCSGFFLEDDLCKGPVMLKNPGCPPEKKPLLFAHQSDIRASCAPGPACSAAPYKAACKDGTCVNALSSSK